MAANIIKTPPITIEIAIMIKFSVKAIALNMESKENIRFIRTIIHITLLDDFFSVGTFSISKIIMCQISFIDVYRINPPPDKTISECKFMFSLIKSVFNSIRGFLKFSTRFTNINSNTNLRIIAIEIPNFLTYSCFSFGAFFDSNAIYNKLSNPNTICKTISIINVPILDIISINTMIIKN